jgi:PilZ domain-containing protein
VYELFPVKVRGRDSTGRAFETDIELDNLSVSGLYLRLAETVAEGEKLFMLVRLSAAQSGQRVGARVAVRGAVLRCEPQPDGKCGLAVVIRHHRLL